MLASLRVIYKRLVYAFVVPFLYSQCLLALAASMLNSLKDKLCGIYSLLLSPTLCHRHLPTSTLSRGGHSASDAAKKVIDYATRRGSDLNDRQKIALARYRTNDIFNLRNLSNDSEIAIFSAYFTFFDYMFFGGLFKLRCSVVLTGKDGDKTDDFGSAFTGGRMVNGRLEVYGIIEIHYATHLKDGYQQRLFMLSTLLHEMLHCFLDFFTCYEPSCRNSLELLGKEHGFAWQDAAYALELSAQDTAHMNLPLDLGRLGSLQHELEQWGNPSVKDLSRWGLAGQNIIS